MKKCAYFIILIVAIALSSCNGAVVTSAEKNKDKFVSKKLQTVCLLDSTEENSPKCQTDISIDYVQSADKERETKINNSILNAIFGYENMSIESAIDSFVAYVNEEYICLRPEYINEKQINENAAWLNEIGLELEKEYGVPWLCSDFKKKNGYKRSTELSKEHNLYRQNYCGCAYSLI